MAAHGHHEVVIESPRHDLDPASMSKHDVGVLIAVYRQRYSELIARPGIATVILFRNHGAAGGASLAHPHSQLVALGTSPQRLRSIADWMQRGMKKSGRCVTCDELAHEATDGRRIVDDTPDFLVLVPFAATTPFEIWLVPKRHQPSFIQIGDGECAELGRLLRNALRRLKSVHGNPPYNLILESFDDLARDAPHAHWRLRVEPDLVVRGGFEVGTGLPINPSSPEQDAASLRSAVTRA
jgi:UDPglucose--hexose-1-phosphate uridylyltransferase